MASNGLKSYIKDATKCPICLEDVENPRSTPCLHTFCLKCLDRHCSRAGKGKGSALLAGEQIECPVCREKFRIPAGGVEQLRHNFFVEGLVSVKRTSSIKADEVGCECCGDETGNTSTVYCVDCREKLCESCAVRCRKRKSGAHKVVRLGDELKPELVRLRGMYCEKHADNTMEMYCSECRVNVCTVCYAVKHRQHVCLEISDIADEFAQQIQNNVRTLSRSVTRLRKERLETEVTRQEMLENVRKIQASIADEADELKKLVDKRVGKMLQQVEKVKAETEKEIDTRQEQTYLTLVAIESFINYSQEMSNKGTPCDITRAVSELNTRAGQLKKMAEIVEPYQVPEIRFTPAAEDKTKSKSGFIKELLGTVIVGLALDSPGKQPVDDDPVVVKQIDRSLGTVSFGPDSPDRHLDCDPVAVGKKVERRSTAAAKTQKAPASPSKIKADKKSPIIFRKIIHTVVPSPRKIPANVFVPLSPTSSTDVPSPRIPATPRLLSSIPVGHVMGVARCKNNLFVVCRQSNTINVFTSSSGDQQQCNSFTVRGLRRPTDIVACAKTKQLYVADCPLLHKQPQPGCIWRVSLDGQVCGKFPSKRSRSSSSSTAAVKPRSVSMGSNRLLVASGSNELVLYGTDHGGELLKRVSVAGIKQLQSAVETSRGTFIVAHWQPKRQISEVDDEGRQIRVYSFDDAGSKKISCSLPCCLSLMDSDGRVFVADCGTQRVLLLNSRLELERVVLDREEHDLAEGPWRMCYVRKTRQLIVACNESKCVQVFRIS